MQDSTQIAGSCHCRNIRFVLLWPEPAPVISARKCSCSFCQKHVGAWTSHPRSKLTVKIIDSSSVSKYRFGTKTADFYVCSACGIVPFVLSEIDEIQYAVVNVHTFENKDALSFSESSINFDGEAIGGRLERRQRNWIPNVQIETSAV